jgi:uncharacterized protein
METEVKEIIETLNELCEDNTVPRNIKAKIQSIIASLNDSEHRSIKVNKALHELDEINADINLPSYVRTQIWNVVSLLEKASKAEE